jgi:hypothetical protein
MRLLLEALDADRIRFPDLGRIYAMEKGVDGSSSIWKAKGIEAIEFSNYDDIYATLREWARYNVNPRNYGRDRVAEILGVASLAR